MFTTNQSEFALKLGKILIVTQNDIPKKDYLIISLGDQLCNLEIIWASNHNNFSVSMVDFWEERSLNINQLKKSKIYTYHFCPYKHKDLIETICVSDPIHQFAQFEIYKLCDYLTIETPITTIICQPNSESEKFWEFFDGEF
jgi:hypothetical protein